MKFKELKLIIRRLYTGYISQYLGRIIFALVLSIIVAGSTSAIAWLLDPAIKKIFIEKDQTYAYLIPLAIILSFSAKGISLFLARTNIIKVGFWICSKLQKQMSEKILKSDLQNIESKHSAKYISNFLYDAGLVQNMVSTAVLNLMKDTLTLVTLLSLMFYQNWKLALFSMIMMPLAAIVAKSLGKRINKAGMESTTLSGMVSTLISETLRGIKVIKIYQKESFEHERTSKAINDLNEKLIKIGVIQIRATPIMEILTGIMIAGFIFYSGTLISLGELEINSFFSFLTAMMLAYQPIRSLATINMVIYHGAAGAKRVFDVLDEQIEILDKDNSKELKLSNAKIEFRNINFKYNSTIEQAVKDISLKIDGGTLAAFVGHSGAGKSTILNLLPRFYDAQAGEILIDDQNIYNCKLVSVRKNISLVSQDVILFDDTVEANILFANPAASKEEVIKACKFAAADEFVHKLPEGYQTIIGENGVKLSGGQKQRLSIARAFIKNAPIILLDEATSSLDTESESKVQGALKQLTKNKTTLVIAHRLSTTQSADKIFVMKKGKIISSGKHQDLLNSCEEYKNLYSKQLK